mmetsp:Transcript_67505/g.78363  ORF Transcript_67505/g.78363 Transcript_67505/m.78363 type:complete len:89 (-) Transcript_67505:440-706(-)
MVRACVNERRKGIKISEAGTSGPRIAKDITSPSSFCFPCCFATHKFVDGMRGISQNSKKKENMQRANHSPKLLSTNERRRHWHHQHGW